MKELLGDEYQDYDLVVAMPNGRPCEERIIAGEFQKLRESAGLPKVVFHSLRHSSTTYKLKLNHGDLKATQGDTGHAQVDMITQVYAHILDEDRKVNAQKFEDSFYASANPDLRTVHPPEPPKPKEPERPAAPPLPGSCGAGGATAKIAGIGKHLGGAFVGSSIRKILLKCRFSKAAVFLSRRDENFPAYFADMQENIDGIFKKTEKCHSGNSETNSRYKPEKTGL